MGKKTGQKEHHTDGRGKGPAEKRHADGSVKRHGGAAGSREGFIPLPDLPLSDGFLFGEVMRDEETRRWKPRK